MRPLNRMDWWRSSSPVLRAIGSAVMWVPAYRQSYLRLVLAAVILVGAVITHGMTGASAREVAAAAPSQGVIGWVAPG